MRNLKETNIGYVYVKNPNSLLGEPYQMCVPTGKTRFRQDGQVEAKFIPISKGYYQKEVWLIKENVAYEL